MFTVAIICAAMDCLHEFTIVVHNSNKCHLFYAKLRTSWAFNGIWHGYLFICRDHGSLGTGELAAQNNCEGALADGVNHVLGTQ